MNGVGGVIHDHENDFLRDSRLNTQVAAGIDSRNISGMIAV